MIPHTIHYCWFGPSPLDSAAQACIGSWSRHFPGYEIKLWNEANYPVDAVPFVSQAYSAGNYAFVSDYARLDILYRHGGIYFDTDVEVIRPFDDILARGPFMGCEHDSRPGRSAAELSVAPGLGMAARPGMELLRELLDAYAAMTYAAPDGKNDTNTIVALTTRALCARGLENSPEPQDIAGFTIYPRDYFCPMRFNSGTITRTPNTRSIHHYSASWLPPVARLARQTTARLRLLPAPLRRPAAVAYATARLAGPAALLRLLTTRLLRNHPAI